MKTILKLTLFVALISLTLWSCKKTDVDQATSEDVRVADLAVSDVFTYTSSEANTKKASTTENGMTVNTAFDDLSGSFTTTITFDNFTPADGVTRNGSLIIKWEAGWFWDSTKTTTVTFDQFSRDSMILSGTLKIKHTTSIEDGLIRRPGNRVDEINMSLTYPDKSTVKWSGWRTIEWESGWLTLLDRTDNVFKINWHKEGTNRLNDTFTGDAENLTLDMSCNKQGFSAGTINLVKADGKQFTINYGDGECDGIYTITDGRRTVEVSQ